MSPEERIERQAVVDQARRWIGTPYHSGADVLGAGVDCGMLLCRAFIDSGVLPSFDPRPYPPDWFVNREDTKYVDLFRRFGDPVPTIEIADVLGFRFGLNWSHGAIVTRVSPLTIIHAFPPLGKVAEEPLAENAQLSRCKSMNFSVWEKRRRASNGMA